MRSNTKGLFSLRFFAACLAGVSAVHVVAGEITAANYATNLADKAACEINLSLIFDAIQQYRAQHQQKLPDKLSDLLPELIYDPKTLLCPFVQKTGDVNSWARRVRVVGKSDLRTSYCYEFCLELISREVWRGPPKTQRQYKEAQLQKLGRPVVPIVRCLAHRPYLNLAYDGKIYESVDVHWEKNFADSPETEDLTSAAVLGLRSARPTLTARDFPARDSADYPHQLDLTKYYNSIIGQPWQGFPENTLGALRPGLHKFGDVQFDVRGAIQLEGHHLPFSFPSKVDGIQVNEKFSRIHFLHATALSSKLGTNVARYTIHYADSENQTRDIPVVYGEQIGDWWFDPKRPLEPTAAKVAWTGSNPAASGHDRSIRLYQFTWNNPAKELLVTHISFVSADPVSGPFLLAITVDP